VPTIETKDLKRVEVLKLGAASPLSIDYRSVECSKLPTGSWPNI